MTNIKTVIIIAAVGLSVAVVSFGHGDEQDSAHMKHMEQVRKWLKTELGDKYDDPVPPATEEQLKEGEAVFKRICITCHGAEGKGDGPAAASLNPKPANFTDPEHSTFYSDQGRVYIIKKGVKGTAMAGWEKTLSGEEITSVYMYVRSLRAPEDNGHGDDHHGHH